LTFARDEPRRSFVGAEDWQYLDFQKSIDAVRLSRPELQITEREVELVDFAVFLIPDLVRCYLINDGIVPFSEEETVWDPVLVRNRLLSEEHFVFVAGVPESSHKPDLARESIGFSLKVFPLHPWPDGESSVDSRRVILAEGQFTWIPTGWDATNWNGHVRGVSGGPVVLQSRSGVVLLGVQTHQRPANKNPDYIGFCDSKRLVETVKLALEEATFQDQLAREGATAGSTITDLS
jgi:hypothetical protein